MSSLTLGDGTVVEVVRSTRRRRSVSASREAGRTVLQAPDRMSLRELTSIAEELHARLVARESRRRPSDDQLHARAVRLARQWLGGSELPDVVRWVGNMRRRWASCTPVDRTIRVSDRLRDAPAYVLDYVLLHELAHLIEAGHNARFWALIEPYPRSAEAKAWLDGFTAGQGLPPEAEEPDEPYQAELFPLPGSSGGSPASSSPDRSSGAERSA